MIDPGTEGQPGPAFLTKGDDFVDRLLGQGILVDCGLQFLRDVFAAARADAFHIEGDVGRLADQRA